MAADGRIEIEGCDTIPKLFWHQVKARDGRTAFREKEFGIWRATSWRDYGERARWTGMGLVKLGLERGEVVSVLANTMPRMALRRHGHHGRRRRSNGIYPTDCGQAGRYILNDSRSRFLFVENDEQLDKFTRGARALPAASPRSSCSTWKGCADFSDPLVMPFDELLALGRELRYGASRPVGGLVAGSQGPRARAAGLHLRHDRPAQGRDAVAPQRRLPDAQRRCLHPARHRRRAARLPAALPHRRAHLHRLPAAALRRHRQFRRERRDGAGEHARGGADRCSSPCRASGNASIPASPSA